MSPRRAIPVKKQSRELPTWLIVAITAIVAIIVVIFGADFIGKMTTSAPSTLSGAGSRTRGSPEAKVEFVEYSDFKCPYCTMFAADTGRRINEAYVKTGKIRQTYKYFVIGDPKGESGWAANAAECANEQGKFWEYHDKLADEGLTGKAVFNKPTLKKYAAELGLDTGKFNACVDSDKYTSVVEATSAEAQSRGIPGTPTFLVNDRVLQLRSLDFSEFARAFDALAR